MDKNQTCFRTVIGGQALIEGIMMRGPDKSATVVRKPDKTMVTTTRPLRSGKDKPAILKWPFIRGVYNFAGAMKDGVKELFYSADVAFEEPDDAPQGFWEKKLGKKRVDDIAMGISGILGIAIPVVLFFILPTLLAGFLDDSIGTGVLRNLIEGLIRIIIFIIFMFSVSRTKDIQRTFEYHGAEHKSIHCYESGKELTVENVQSFPKEHPRCGTSFLLVVMVISILVFSFIEVSSPLWRVVIRLALLPVVVGISYECNRWIGRHDNAFTRIVRAPGLLMQHLTTREPDDSMVEVAITALKAVIPEEEGSDKW
ncbi:MAG: DUF1385 domain-containing protein [Ruminococcaceae bacterium]|nr:DUF1385 domain-containing protein [Oscillospiraceae bacterium]